MLEIKDKTHSYSTQRKAGLQKLPASVTCMSFGAQKSPVQEFNALEEFIKFRKNNKDDLFIRDFLVNKAKQDGVAIPQGFSINIKSPNFISEEKRQELHHLIFGEFKGYINYFFELMSEESRDTFVKKVQDIKVAPEAKEKLIGLYDYLDNFYQIELSLNGSNKVLNLSQLTDENKQRLLAGVPEDLQPFMQSLFKNLSEAKQMASKFSRSEVERNTLCEAGESSKNFIKKLIIGTVGLATLEHYRPAIVGAMGAATPLGKAFDKSTEFIGGCGDDVLAGYKDYLQDEVTLGKSTATKILIGGTITGILTSGYAASVGVGTMLGAIIFANASSGSSIFSNVAAFGLIFKNFDKMVEKGIIKLPSDNMSKFQKFKLKLKTAWKNYSAYDAYIGKVIGLLACTPVAMLVFKAGMFSNKFKTTALNNTAKALGLMILGSIESYIPMVIQYVGDNYRKAKIKLSKDLAAKSSVNIADYNSRKYKFEGRHNATDKAQLFKNFIDTYKK